MISQKNKAFTLVELIVVIVILAILATIAFLSFNSYSSSSRDSVRLADITNIAKGLTLQYTVGGYYIIPDNSVNLYSGSTIIGYQGKAGYNTLNTIKLSANTNNTSGRDPIDNTYYTYNTNINKNRYQVTGYLENKGTIINRTSYINNSNNTKGINNLIDPFDYAQGDIINQAYATTYTNRFPYTKGDSIGVILNYTGTTANPIYTPIEDITTSTGIDISSGTLTSGKIIISNNSDSSTGVSTISMSGYVNNVIITNGNNIPAWTIAGGGDCVAVDNSQGVNGNTGACIDNRNYIMQGGATHDKTYSLLKIEGRWWFNENIAYPPLSGYKGSNSWSATDQGFYSCPGNNSTANIDCNLVSTLGYLYQWSTALAGGISNNNQLNRTQGICPDGWAIPTKADFTSVSNSYWPTNDSDNNGNTVGWNRTYAGNRNNDSSGIFYTRGANEHIWSSFESSSTEAWYEYFYSPYPTQSIHYTYNKGIGFPVRCIKN